MEDIRFSVYNGINQYKVGTVSYIILVCHKFGPVFVDLVIISYLLGAQ